MVRTNYPETVIDVLADDMQYAPAAIEAVKKFAASNPWKGSLNLRKKKFRQINKDLSIACNINKPTLLFGILNGGSSGSSFHNRKDHLIVMVGKLSVVTYLHEFAHAMGFDERKACQWSINLFRKCFPRQYSRLMHVGHTLVRQQDIFTSLNKESVR